MNVCVLYTYEKAFKLLDPIQRYGRADAREYDTLGSRMVQVFKSKELMEQYIAIDVECIKDIIILEGHHPITRNIVDSLNCIDGIEVFDEDAGVSYIWEWFEDIDVRMDMI